MIKIVVTGSECTGKTTLACALGEAYGAPVSLEFVREFVERTGTTPGPDDVDRIARGQVASEDEAIRRARGLVILDTDLLSTLVYSRHYYGGCPGWVEKAVLSRAGDLYLLAGIDVPWEPDGLQRDRGHHRVEMQERFRTELNGRGLRFAEVSGRLEERLALSRTGIDALLSTAHDRARE